MCPLRQLRGYARQAALFIQEVTGLSLSRYPMLFRLLATDVQSQPTD